jgi:hypothetical protein
MGLSVPSKSKKVLTAALVTKEGDLSRQGGCLLEQDEPSKSAAQSKREPK